MRKTIGFFIFFGVLMCYYSNQVLAQDFKKSSLNVSFSNVKFCDWEYYFSDESMPNLALKYNRAFSDYFSFGGYGGVGLYDECIVRKGDQSVGRMFNKMSFSIIMGLNGKMHLLSLSRKNSSNFDCYVIGNIGVIYFMSSESDTMNIRPERGFVVDLSAYLGVAYYFKGNWGPFFELGYRNFKYHKTTRPAIVDFNAGLTFKF